MAVASTCVAGRVGFISLLLAVIFVIVTPPFWIKVPLLAFSACGLFVFARRSHWTHSWHPLYQYGSAVIVVGILAAIAVPHLAAQWRSDHPVAGPPPRLEHVYDLSGDRRTKFEESLKKQTEPKAIVRVGCDDQSEQSCLAAGRFLLAISEAGWEIDSKQVFRMRQTIPKEGVSVAWNDRNAEKFKNLPPHEGFWHSMSPGELTFYWAFRAMDIPVNGVNDSSLPEGMIGIYFGPEPQR